MRRARPKSRRIKPQRENPFFERFSLSIDVQEAQRRFINRATDQLFTFPFITDDYLKKMKPWYVRCVAYDLGELSSEANSFASLAKHDFLRCLQIIESIYSRLADDPNVDQEVTVPVFESSIYRNLESSEVDLGVAWKKGRLHPSGAKELDDALINESLEWLNTRRFANVAKPFSKALDHYLHAVTKPALLHDVITDAYEALEAMAKILTGRDTKDLSANRELFIRQLKVSPSYSRLVFEYIQYANKYRHAAGMGTAKQTPLRHEVESFLYMTGLFLRLAQASLDQKEDI